MGQNETSRRGPSTDEEPTQKWDMNGTQTTTVIEFSSVSLCKLIIYDVSSSAAKCDIDLVE